MKRKFFTLSLIVYAWFSLGFGTVLLAQTPDSSPVPAVQPQQIQPDAERIAVLQAQMELMRDYHEKILDTVYWSLGLSITILAVFTGLGWFANFKIYKRDVEDIKRENENNLYAFKTQLNSEMLDKAKEAGKAALSGIDSNVKNLQYEMLQLEAKDYENKGSYANALFAYARIIPIVKKELLHFRLARILENMITILRTKEVIWSVELKHLIKDELNDIPDKFSMEVNDIIELIRLSQANFEKKSGEFNKKLKEKDESH
ncbi:MAG: hypothetical protein M3367_13530 [Acidobacteriota bacterium]|nr:hypothetical protein [Acidobacteriota bacterium]